MADDVVLRGEALDKAMSRLPDWEVKDDWIRKTFMTPGWPHTMMLVQTIGYLAEAAWHHPDLSVGYAKVTVKLQTHRAGGITMHDIELAQKIDEVVLWQPTEESVLDGFPKKWVHPA